MAPLSPCLFSCRAFSQPASSQPLWAKTGSGSPPAPPPDLLSAGMFNPTQRGESLALVKQTTCCSLSTPLWSQHIYEFFCFVLSILQRWNHLTPDLVLGKLPFFLFWTSFTVNSYSSFPLPFYGHIVLHSVPTIIFFNQFPCWLTLRCLYSALLWQTMLWFLDGFLWGVG